MVRRRPGLQGHGRSGLTAQRPRPISRPALPDRLMVRLRTLTPSIEVRILVGHPAFRSSPFRAALSRAQPVCQTGGRGDGGHAQRLSDGRAGRRTSDGRCFGFAMGAGPGRPDPAGAGRGGRRLSDRPGLGAAIAAGEGLACSHPVPAATAGRGNGLGSEGGRGGDGGCCRCGRRHRADPTSG